jgi:hypothetical protein
MWQFFKKWLTYLSDGLTRQAITELLFWCVNNYIIAPAGLATGAFATPVVGSNPLIVMINGAVVSKAGGSAFPALTGLSLTAGQTGCVLFGIDANGNLYSFISPTILASATSLVGLVWPVPADSIPTVIVGGVIIQNVTNPFVGGTTNLNATGVTSTFFNAPAGSAPFAPVTFR